MISGSSYGWRERTRRVLSRIRLLRVFNRRIASESRWTFPFHR